MGKWTKTSLVEGTYVAMYYYKMECIWKFEEFMNHPLVLCGYFGLTVILSVFLNQIVDKFEK